MQFYGKVVVIKRNGMDGNHYPLTAECCLFGRDLDCDVRIQLPAVDNKQCEIEIDGKGHPFIKNLSSISETLINDKVLSSSLTALAHGDIITIVDRRFRFEFPEGSKLYPLKSPKKSPRTPKDVHTPKTGAAENSPKMLRRSSPVSPLSPRTDNVPQSTKSSPSSAQKNVSEPVPPVSEADTANKSPKGNSIGSQKNGATPGVLFGLSPASFYNSPITSRALKNLSDSQQGKSPEVGTLIIPERSSAASSRSGATPNRQRSPGSPYSKVPANLRKSITDLRRRSAPVFEIDEDTASNPAKIQQEDVPVIMQAGIKRKASNFDFMSAKRKRVSFGPNLSPEHFDKSLPPKTPIKKGATPGRINRQERKSLLKMKSQRGKSASPNGPTPKKVSPLKTPVKSPLASHGDYIEASSSSPVMEIVASPKQQSPRSKPLDPSLSLRSTPKTIPEQRDMLEKIVLKSPNNKSPSLSVNNTPKGISTTPAFSQNLTSNRTPDTDFVSPFSSPKIMSSVLSVSPSSQKIQSPALQLAVSQKSVTPRRSSSSLQKSVTPRRSNSSLKSVTPRRLTSSPHHATPRRSSSSPKKSVTPRRSSSSPLKAVTPRRSNSSPQNSVTPRRSSSSPKNSVTPRRSSSSPQNSVTPRRSNSSPQNSVTPRRSSSSPKNSATPGRSSSSPHVSPGRSSSSPHATPGRSSSSPHVTPGRSSSSPHVSPGRSSSSPHVSPGRSSSSPHVTHGRSSSSPHVTPARSSSSPHVSPGRSSSSSHVSPGRSISSPHVTPGRSSSSPHATPARSSSSPHVSPGRSSSSPHATPGRSSSSPHVTPGRSSSSPHATPGRSSSSHQKTAKPRLSVPTSPKRSSLSLVKSASSRRSSSYPPPLKYSSEIVDLPLSQQSPDLFSQKSPKAVGRKSAADKVTPFEDVATGSPNLSEGNLATPNKIKRLTPKQKNTNSVKISPTGIRRIMKTPKEKTVKISAVSPTGIRNLVKTPRVKRANQPVGTPSGLKRLLKTPKTKQVLETSLKGVKEMMKTPRTIANASFSGLSAMFITPTYSKHNASSTDFSSNCATPLPKNLVKPVDTPRPVFSEKRHRSPKTFFDETQPTKSPSVPKKLASPKLTAGSPKQLATLSEKRPVGRPPSAKKTVTKHVSSPAGKIISPPQDFNKVVALRAIHGHSITPRKVATLKVHTPKSSTKSAKKTPYKKMWSDIVKSGVQKPVPIKSFPLPARTAVSKRKSPALVKSARKMPKTPRTIARALAPTTGHADSPATIIVGKKALGSLHALKPLPRKGRKPSLSKATRKSAGNTSFTGLAEMFTEPADMVLNESSLYADIPDTPNGPNEMFVSPLSSRKSTNFTGVRELFLRKAQRNSDFTGVKELFVSSDTASPASPSRMKRVVKTPKKFTTDVSPAGLKRLMATPKTKADIASPAGMNFLFNTPLNVAAASPQVGKYILKQAQHSTKTQTGAIGRKRRAEDSGRKPSAKKIRLSPTQKVTITADTPATIITQGGVQHGKVPPSPPKSAGRGRPRKLQNLTSAPSGESVIHRLDGNAAPSPAKIDKIKGQEQTIVAAVVSPYKTTGLGQVLNAASNGETALSPPKSAGKGRPRKSLILNSAPVDQATKDCETTVPEIRDQVLESCSPNKIVAVESALSPAKTSGRSSRGPVDTSEAAPSPPKTAGRGRKAKVPVIEAAAAEETASLSAAGKTAPSPPKAAGRGKQRKVILEAAPLKKAGRGRKVEAAVVEETGTLTAASIAGPSPSKAAGRGRRKQEILVAALSSPKKTGIGRKNKGQIIEVETATSPPKATGRDRRGQVLEAASSPPKTTGRGRKNKVQITGAVVDKETAVKAVASPPKAAGRGKRGQVILEASSSSPKPTGRGKKIKLQTIDVVEEATSLTATASPPKAAARGRRGQVILQATSPPKITGRGRKNIFHSEADELYKNEKTLPSLAKDEVQILEPSQFNKTNLLTAAVAPPPKAAGRGRKTKEQAIEPGAIKETATLTAAVKTASSPPKAAGRGKVSLEPAKKAGRGRKVVQIIEAAVDEENATGKTAASSPKPAGRGRRGQAALKVASPPTKTVGLGRRGVKKDTTAAAPLPLAQKPVLSPPKTTSAAKKGASLQVESGPSPVKSRGTRKQIVTSLPSPVQELADSQIRGKKRKAGLPDKATPEKKVKVDTPVQVTQAKSRTTRGGKTAKVSPVKGPSPVKVSSEGARGLSKKAAAVSADKASPAKGRQGQLKKTEVQASPAKGRQGQLKKTEVQASPAKGRQGQLKKTEVQASPAKGRQGQLKKTEVQASPAKGRRGQLKKTEVPASPAKGRQGQLKKTEVQASPAKGRQGQLKKTEVQASPAKGRRGQLKKTEVQASPAKGRRGQLKKTEVQASPGMRKPAGAKAAPLSPKPRSVQSKKITKQSKASPSKPGTGSKSTLATRQRK